MGFFLSMGWIEEGLISEHGAGDGKQSIGDGSQRSGVAVSPGPKGGIALAADGIVLDGDAGPVVKGGSQPNVAGLTHDDETAFAAPAGNGGGAGQGAQGLVISFPQGRRGFCEQRGEDGPPDSGHGKQDVHVALLGFLPRGAVLLIGDVSAEAVDAASGLLDLAVDQAQTLGQGTDMSASGGDSSRRDGERLLAQEAQHFRRVDFADAVGFQQLGNGIGPDAPRLLGSGRLLPQGEKPLAGDIVADLQGLGIIASQLFAQVVGEAHALLAEVLGPGANIRAVR